MEEKRACGLLCLRDLLAVLWMDCALAIVLGVRWIGAAELEILDLFVFRDCSNEVFCIRCIAQLVQRKLAADGWNRSGVVLARRPQKGSFYELMFEALGMENMGAYGGTFSAFLQRLVVWAFLDL